MMKKSKIENDERMNRNYAIQQPLLNTDGDLEESEDEHSEEYEYSTYDENKQSSQDKKVFAGSCPLDNASVFSQMFFFWVNPLIKYCKTERLSPNMLGNMMKGQTVSVYKEKLETCFEQRKNNGGHALFWSLMHCFWREFAIATLLNCIAAALSMASPYFLKEIMEYIEDDTGSYSKYTALVYVFLIFVSQYLSNLILENVKFYQLIMGSKASQSMAALVYAKTLRISPATNKKYKKGDIVNFIQVDARTFIYFSESLPSVARLPLVLIFCIIMLFVYFEYSFLSGLMTIVVLAIINFILAKLTIRCHEVLMKKRDIRMNIMTECLDNIQLIKLNAWVERFIEKIETARKNEIFVLFWRSMITVTNVLMQSSTYPLCIIATFATAVFGVKLHMSIPIAVASTQLFNLLKVSARWMPFFVGMLVEFLVSISRIQDFLLCDEVDLTMIDRHLESQQDSLQIIEGNFTWGSSHKDRNEENKESENNNPGEIPFVIENLNLNVKQGEFVAIIGEVGSGKSSLIHSVIGDMIYKPNLNHASFDENEARNSRSRQVASIPIKINGKLSLIEQRPWIQNNTIRNNILFGADLNPERYNRVIELSQLVRDLQILEGGDLTEIGEKGINLSGGQKARISIARAIYTDSDVVLMDDPLSALDAHVKNKIFKHVLCEELKDKTRILVTHAIDFLDQVDRILVMEKGKIIYDGTFDDLKRNEYFQLILDHMDKDEKLEEEKDTSSDENIEPSEAQRNMSVGNYMSRKGTSITSNENEEDASVNWKLYFKYFCYNKLVVFLFIASLLFMSISQSCSVMFDIYLLKWVKEVSDTKTNDFGSFLLILIFCATLLICVVLSVYLIFIFSIRVSKNLFKSINRSVFSAPINLYFDKTPTGVILNRFSKDLYVTDHRLPETLIFLALPAFQTIAAIAVAVYNVIWVLLIIPFLTLICYFLSKSFIRALKETSRVEGVTNSPVLTHLGETILGASTIRAYEKTRQFEEHQYELQDANLICMIMNRAVSSWFGLRLYLAAQLMIATSYTYCVICKDQLDPIVIAVMMVYLVQIQISLITTLSMVATTEQRMVSFNRCYNLLEIPHENEQFLEIPNDENNEPWISRGRIQFDHYSVRYRPDTEIVLNDICLDIKANEKIGVVGRTGAGKSTLCLALCRIIEAHSGCIKIDGVDISTVGLSDLRNRITIIPQEATLFEGTLKFNLDPDNKSSDEEIMRLLNKAGIAYLTVRDGQGLDFKIESKGENLSSGEKQLICICRAILRKNKIVLMDEATANIDIKVEAIVQKLIKEEFKDSTVITVAHRLNTVLTSDKILVLDFGKVLEFETPETLSTDPNSEFYSLLNEFKK